MVRSVAACNPAGTAGEAILSDPKKCLLLNYDFISPSVFAEYLSRVGVVFLFGDQLDRRNIT